MLSNYHPVSDYIAELLVVIRRAEVHHLTPYYDKAGDDPNKPYQNVTIGDGINIDWGNTTHLKLVLAEIGLVQSSTAQETQRRLTAGEPAETAAQRTARLDAMVQAFRNLMTNNRPALGALNVDANNAALSQQMNALAAAYGGGPFVLDTTGSATIVRRIVTGGAIPDFGGQVEGKQSRLDQRLGQTAQNTVLPHNSKEYLALMSMFYNGESTIPEGSNLAKAIRANNRAEAWFEIRYGTNKGALSTSPSNIASGIAKRRFWEAELFGLYGAGTDTPQNIPQDDAFKVYRMYTEHQETIAKYESRYAHKIDEANADYVLAGPDQVRSLTASLSSAGGYLVNQYVRPFDSALADSIDMRSIQLGKDNAVNVLTGDFLARSSPQNNLSTNDLLIGGDQQNQAVGDTLYGREGNDTLVGRKGNDHLSGGTGSDVYIYASGDGKDEIADADGKIFVSGVEIKGARSGQDGFQYRLAGRSRIWEKSDGTIKYEWTDNTLTISGSALGAAESNQIEVSNFQNGNLGVTLTQPPQAQLTAGLGANPWQQTGYAAQTLSTTAIEGGAKTIVANLNSALPPGARLALSLTGQLVAIASKLGIVFEGETLAFGSEPVEIPVGSDQTQIAFSLINLTDIDNDPSGGLKVMLLDADGNAIQGPDNSEISNTLLVEFASTLEAAYEYDGAPQVGTSGRDEIVDSFDSNLREHIVGGGGNDYISTRRNNDLIEDLGAGSVVLAGEGDDRVFVGAVVEGAQLDAVIQAGASQEGLLTTGALIGGASGEDIIVGGERSDTLLGGSHDDLIVGNGGQDVMFGDSYTAFTTGNWHVELTNKTNADGSTYVDFDWNVTTGIAPTGSTIDSVEYPAGTDRMYGGGGNDFMWGDDADDFLSGDDGDDVVLGGQGNDTLLGGKGADYMFGETDKKEGAPTGDDVMHGGDGGDFMQGNKGADILFGEAGNDTLIGDDQAILDGAGNDILDGGEGDDELFGAAGNDDLYGGAGNDTMMGDSVTTPTQGHGNDFLDGGVGADIMAGFGGSDTLLGGDGDDVMTGDDDQEDGQHHGADKIYGEAGQDQIVAGAGNDYVDGGADLDQIDGGKGNDTVFGGTGNDTIFGGDGEDTLVGEEGGDTIVGDKGESDPDGGQADLIWGDAGEDKLFGQGGDDYIDGGDDKDQLDGGAGKDTLLGGAGDDSLSGGDGDDYLDGGAGKNEVQGGGGNDTLIVGTDGGLYAGGAGDDTYIVQNENSISLIVDTEGNNTYLVEGSGSGGATELSTTYTLVTQTGQGQNIQYSDTSFTGSKATLKIQSGGASVLIQDGFKNAGATIELPGGEFSTIRSLINTQYTGNLAVQGDDRDEDIASGLGNDDVAGGAGNDIITASAGDDFLDGGEGNDTLDGGAGDDYLDGGAGDDILIGGQAGTKGDMLEGGAGDDRYIINLGDGGKQIMDSEGVSTISFGAGVTREGLQASVAAIAGGSMLVTIDYGVEGDRLNVVLSEQGGEFMLEFDDGTEVWLDEYLGLPTKSIYGTSSVDLFEGTSRHESYHGLKDDDQIFGNGGNDMLFGEQGSDTIDGGDGDDTLDGGEGEDILEGKAGNDTLRGGDQEDHLFGGEGNDVLQGGSGTDKLEGGDGNDVLVGGVGSDELSGGLDNDIYQIGKASGLDIVRDENGLNVLEFTDGIVLADLAREVMGNDLLIHVKGQAGADEASGINGVLIRNFQETNWTLKVGDQEYTSVSAEIEALPRVVTTDVTALRSEILGLAHAHAEREIIRQMGAHRGENGGLYIESRDTSETGELWSRTNFRVVTDVTDHSQSNEPNAGLRSGLQDTPSSGSSNPTTVTRTVTYWDPIFEGSSGGTGGLDARRYVHGPTPPDIGSKPATPVFGPGNGPNGQTVVGWYVYDEGQSGGQRIVGYNKRDVPVSVEVTLNESTFDYVINDYQGGDGGNVAISYGPAVMKGGAGNDYLYAAGPALLEGGAGNDTLSASNGKGYLIGGHGSDYLSGSDGQHVYIFNAGETGVDLVDEAGTSHTLRTVTYSAGGPGDGEESGPTPSSTRYETQRFGEGLNRADTLRFGSGIQRETMRKSFGWYFDGSQTRATLNLHVGPGQVIRILIPDIPQDSIFYPDPDDQRSYTQTDYPDDPEVGIELVEFADGNVWSLNDLIDELTDLTQTAPVVGEALVNQSVAQDAEFVYALPSGAFQDPDAGDVLTYTAALEDGSALPKWLRFDAETMTFSGTPPNDAVGVISVRVTATDFSDLSVDQVFTIQVTNVNDPPIVSAEIADQTALAQAAFAFVIPEDAFIDIDGDALTYTATLESGDPLPTWLTFDAVTRTFSGTPGLGDFGVANVRVTVTDPSGSTASDVFALTVRENHAPDQYSGFGLPTLFINQSFEYELPTEMFRDPDGDILTYSATLVNGDPLPTWLTFDAATLTFSGTPDAGDIGVMNIRVTATDAWGLSAYTDATVTVRPPNQAPIPADDDPIQFYAPPGVFYRTPRAHELFVDPDGDDLQFTLDREDGLPRPTWMRLVQGGGAWYIGGTPPASAAGQVINLIYTATDQFGLVATQRLVLRIEAAPPMQSDPPESGLEAKAEAGATFTYDLPDGLFENAASEALTYEATMENGSALPSWLNFDVATGKLSGAPTAEDVGTLEVTITAKGANGYLQSAILPLTVTDSEPGFEAVSDTASVVEGETTANLVDLLLANDTFEEGETYRIFSVNTTGTMGKVLFDEATQSLTYTADSLKQKALELGENRQDQFTYTVVDSKGAVQTATVTLDVTGADDTGGGDTPPDDEFETREGTDGKKNHAPEVAKAFADRNLMAGQIFAFSVPSGSFVDDDKGDRLTLSAKLANGEALPSWLRFNALSKVFSGRVPPSLGGPVEVTITATDSQGESVNDTFVLNVKEQAVQTTRRGPLRPARTEPVYTVARGKPGAGAGEGASVVSATQTYVPTVKRVTAEESRKLMSADTGLSNLFKGNVADVVDREFYQAGNTQHSNRPALPPVEETAAGDIALKVPRGKSTGFGDTASTAADESVFAFRVPEAEEAESNAIRYDVFAQLENAGKESNGLLDLQRVNEALGSDEAQQATQGVVTAEKAVFAQAVGRAGDRTFDASQSRWALMESLLDSHLDNRAGSLLGGDTVLGLGLDGAQGGIGLDPAKALLADSSLNANAKSLTAVAQLQTGNQRLS